jgi:hypothetical protein
MPRLSQFESAKLDESGHIHVKGPAGGTAEENDPHAPHTPVHFAVVRDGHVLTGTGAWTDEWHWSGKTDRGLPHLTAGPAYAFALEVRFWWEDAGQLESAGGYQTYAWSQEIDLQAP